MSVGPASSKRRLIRVLLAVVVFVIAGAGVFLASTELPHKSPPNAFAAGAGSHSITAISSAAATTHDVLFVGASYTAGLGATPPTEGYAYLIGRTPGWQAQINGVSGTGFLNPGPKGNQTFAERIALQPTRPRPDLVIFQGGRNDVNFSADKLRAAAINTANLTRKRFGNGTQVVFLGPIPAHAPAPDDQLAVANTLRSAAAAAHAVFIDPIAQSWITLDNEQNYVGRVPAHPDNAGYAYIAQRLLSDLQALYAHHDIS